MAVDLKSGNAVFYKLGASSSYIIMNDELTIIEGNSKLIGDVNDSFDIPKNSLQLSDNARIIITSDGAELDQTIVSSIGQETKRKNMKFTAKRFIMCSENDISDDKTVITLRLRVRTNQFDFG